jgi:hypothetical protein
LGASLIRRASHNACVSPVAVGVGAAVVGIGRADIAVDIDAIVAISPPVTAVVGRCGAAVAAAHAQSAAMKITLNAATSITQTSGTPEIRETTSKTGAGLRRTSGAKVGRGTEAGMRKCARARRRTIERRRRTGEPGERRKAKSERGI